MNWTDAVESYIATLNPSTAYQYRIGLQKFAAWHTRTYGSEPKPTLLTDEDARDWRDYLSDERKLRAATVNQRLSALKGLARFCGRQLQVPGIRRVQPPIEPLTGRELSRLFAVVESSEWGPKWLALRNGAMVALMGKAGMRVGEVVGLDVGDVDINTRSGWATIRRGKGRKERKVPLSLQARKSLREYLDARPKWAGEPLFISKTGKRVDKRDVQRTVSNSARRADIEKKVTAHVLRHTFATRFLRNGGDLATLQSVLGHANIETTSRYLHPDAARVQEMVEEL